MAIVSSGQLTLTDLNDTKQLILYLNANYRSQIYDPTASSYSPSFSSTNLIITPELYVAGGSGSNMLPSTAVKSITWYEGTQTTTAIAENSTGGTTTAGYTYTIPTGTVGTTAKPLTIKSNLSATQIYTCVIVYTDPDTNFDITIKANSEIQRVQNGTKGNTGNTGTNGVTAFLTNSAVVLPATNAGAVSVFTGSATDIYVYDGTTALTFLTSGTAGNGQFTVTTSISPASGVTLATPTVGTAPARAVYGNITAMASGSDNVSVTFTISGKTVAGTAISATVVQTFGKSKQALDGTTPSSYWLTTNYDTITKDPYSGIFSPTQVVATSNVQVGSGAPNRTTSMKWLIGTSTDGSTFADGSVLTGTTATSTALVANATTKALRFRMYLSTTATPDGTNFVDEQIIWVVQNGTDSYYLNVWTPNGDTIRNSSGNLTIEADLYKGAGTVTPTAFKWYQQDPTATTASGGDVDGGNGWRLINGVTDPTTTATLALSANTATRMTATTYYVRYTWVGLSGESLPTTTEASLAVTASNDLKITIPAFPTGVYGANIYVGTVAGSANLHYQGEITVSAGSLTLTSYDSSGAVPPTTSTTTTAQVTGATITVIPNAIAGVEGYKCVATAPTIGTKFSGLAIVRDMQDPVAVNILGANIIKNGQGSVVLQAQLIQNGVEISTAGYSFSWALYNQDGSLNKTLTGSSDTITVNASDFNGVNNLIVDVSK